MGSSDKRRIAYQEFGSEDNSTDREPAVPDLPPKQQSLLVQTTKKGRKGKTVTVISGFEAQPETLAKLLKQLKSQCGSGGAVKDKTLEIQGDQQEKLAQLLTALGYKVKW